MKDRENSTLSTKASQSNYGLLTQLKSAYEKNDLPTFISIIADAKFTTAVPKTEINDFPQRESRISDMTLWVNVMCTDDASLRELLILIHACQKFKIIGLPEKGLEAKSIEDLHNLYVGILYNRELNNTLAEKRQQRLRMNLKDNEIPVIDNDIIVKNSIRESALKDAYRVYRHSLTEIIAGYIRAEDGLTPSERNDNNISGLEPVIKQLDKVTIKKFLESKSINSHAWNIDLILRICPRLLKFMLRNSADHHNEKFYLDCCLILLLAHEDFRNDMLFNFLQNSLLPWDDHRPLVKSLFYLDDHCFNEIQPVKLLENLDYLTIVRKNIKTAARLGIDPKAFPSSYQEKAQEEYKKYTETSHYFFHPLRCLPLGVSRLIGSYLEDPDANDKLSVELPKAPGGL